MFFGPEAVIQLIYFIKKRYQWEYYYLTSMNVDHTFSLPVLR